MRSACNWQSQSQHQVIHVAGVIVIEDKHLTGLMGMKEAKALLMSTAQVAHGLFAMSKTGLGS